MDNLTHSLVGLIAGEALARLIPANNTGLPLATRRGVFVTATVVGGNLPDLDLLYSYRGPSTNNLTYMLEHRGYTHTVVGCLLLALLLYGGIEAWLQRRRFNPSRTDHVALLGVAMIGIFLHLGMDALNSYGVHPFWPFQNHWIYGDSLFIVEPLYWAAAAPLMFALRSAIARIFLGLVLIAAVVASVASGFVAPVAYGMLIVFIAVMLGIGRWCDERTAALASAVAVAFVTVSFITAGQAAAKRVEAMAHAEFPTSHMVDHVLAPMPANPLCWEVLVLQTTGDQYVSRRAILALAPKVIPADRCAGRALDQDSQVPQTSPAIHDATAIRWKEFKMPATLFATLVASSCDAAALMRFARAPFAIPNKNGLADQPDWLMGDLRFDRGRRLGFSTIRVGSDNGTAPPHCPWTPTWDPPRADLRLTNALP